MISFTLPFLIVLLPLPWVVRRFATKGHEPQQAALKVPFYQALVPMEFAAGHFSVSRPRMSVWLVYGIWLALVIAAMGPRWVGEPIPLQQRGRNILLALDISGSMATPDLSWQGQQAQRLTVVKQVAGEFIRHRQGDRLGLILFGSRAYLQTPLTFDSQTVQAMLDDATIGLAGQQTAIGDAIGLGVKRLIQHPAQSNVLIVLTDGANNSGAILPMEAAQLAKKQNIKIYTIGIGANSLIVNSVLGPKRINPSADLDEGTLKAIARLTGGAYFRAKDTKALAAAYKKLNQLEPMVGKASFFRPSTPLYPWLLAVALLLSFLLAWRHVPVFSWRRRLVREPAA